MRILFWALLSFINSHFSFVFLGGGYQVDRWHFILANVRQTPAVGLDIARLWLLADVNRVSTVFPRRSLFLEW
jgi:hypothetical protein